jgi:hypothetical protein
MNKFTSSELAALQVAASYYEEYGLTEDVLEDYPKLRKQLKALESAILKLQQGAAE